MKISPVALAAASLLLLPIAGVSAEEVNDAQIASIVVTANQVDIDAGQLAASLALEVTPQDNPTSQSLKADGEKNLAHLKTLKGTAFDTAYIEREVAYHQQVIDALDKILIPGATTAELKALLVKVRPAFVAHLEHAKRLQAAQKH
jgi:putative membrane protein